MYSQKILTYFPPPTFLEMPSVGLDVTDEAVYLVELKRGKGGFVLGMYAEKPLPRGMVEGGHINDPEGLSKILKELRDQYNLRYVRASLPEEKTYLFRTEIPYTDDRKQIKSSLEFRLEDNVPIPPSETIFEFDVISHHESTDHLDVSVSAVPEKVISTYANVLRSAGLTPLSFEVETRAIAKSVIREGDGSTCMVIDVGALKTGIYIVSGGVVRFSSTLTLDLSNEKKEDGDRETISLLALKAEITRIHTYWNTHSDKTKEVNPKIDKILLSGQTSSFLKLDQYLAGKLQVPVELANVWCNVCSFGTCIPSVDFSKSLDYAVAIGLVLSQYHI